MTSKTGADATNCSAIKLADVFTALALLLIAFIAFATGFEPQFNGLFAIAAVVLLFLGAITDSVWRRFRRR